MEPNASTGGSAPYRPPSWAFLAIVTLVLLIIVCVPPMYAETAAGRDTFLAVMVPCVSLLYGICYHFIIGRDVAQVSESIRLRRKMEVGGLTKEVRQIRKGAAVLRNQNDKMLSLLLSQNQAASSIRTTGGGGGGPGAVGHLHSADTNSMTVHHYHNNVPPTSTTSASFNNLHRSGGTVAPSMQVGGESNNARENASFGVFQPTSHNNSFGNASGQATPKQTAATNSARTRTSSGGGRHGGQRSGGSSSSSKRHGGGHRSGGSRGASGLMSPGEPIG